jgi:Secretion system C-terminal sorting domain
LTSFLIELLTTLIVQSFETNQETMSSIQIPEPCHENWADFTPTQKGAFCGSCQIDVVDFSDKSPNEVKSILKQNAGQHMCGRFRKSQLAELNNDFHLWENQSQRTFQSKFLYACLLVFGMSLFTSATAAGNTFLHHFGIMKESKNPIELALFDIDKTIMEVESDTNKIKKNEYKKGKVKYVPEEKLLGKPILQELETNIPDSLEKAEECFVKGDVAYTPQENVEATEDSLVENFVLGDTILYNDEMIDGEISWDEGFDEYVEDSTNTEDVVVETIDTLAHLKGQIVEVNQTVEIEETDSTHQNTNDTNENQAILSASIFESMLYPNPTRDKTTVVINVNEASRFNIYLYAISGKMVKDIYTGMLESGRQEFVLDLSAYQTGSYLIVINSNSQKESLRLQKVN